MSTIPGELLILGCGFLGLRVAKLWLARGGRVRAVTREVGAPSKSRQLQAIGITPVVADLMNPERLQAALSGQPIDRVLYCVGYDRNSPVSKEALYLDGLTNVLDIVADRVNRFVYVSSSSVYGQDDGSWVDEDSPTVPGSDGGRTCLQAEQRLRQRVPNATILRMSGLYGPERLLVRREQLLSGEPIGGNPDAWLNLIHGDDAAHACERALTAESLGPLYLCSNDQPQRRRTYFETIARQFGAPPPNFSGEPTTRHSGLGLNKRCRSDRVKRELGVRWIYPTVDTAEQTPAKDPESLGSE